MSKKPVESPLKMTQRTSAGLRGSLFDELDGLRKGTINATRANAVAKLATTIIETVRVELDVMKYRERNKQSPGQAVRALSTAIELGE